MQNNRCRAALVGCGRMGAFIDNEVAGRPNANLPYSHAAGYEACDRTDLVAGSDMRTEVLEQFGQRYGVGPEHQYTDFRDMIVREQPDILSIATQPHHRAEVALFAIENGVKALYVEKPLCASMAEADALREAVTRHNVALNMGTNRRWHPGFAVMREAIASGAYGNLVTLATFHKATLFNTQSHWIDTLRLLNDDAPAACVQGYLPDGDAAFDGDQVIADPHCEGTIGFTNGVTAHLISTPGAPSHHAWCESAELVMTAGDSRIEVRRDGQPAETLDFTASSSTLRLIEDLVHALDTGEPTRGGIDAAYANTELLFGLLESQRRDGARVSLPLVDSRLAFVPANLAPRQPKYSPTPA
jgi:predicted dehydrogenase